ncbi:multidrug resistance efflux pump [Bradyrhizobium sp. USDA 4524]|uniref:HlyD family secretion protein n=1 Tax=unclassified Bradyrhizobium TaxID=2631580 RepID=UPI00209CC107|nr:MULTISPECIES: HlyD family secretion protein [unclassified Bradyrhizobium]MCP1845703.1 multidrug resistance efflux pump [Bradyrhizobium sp. USDA 4538]MCP1846051.1 multidrug resistance efflux pump [Bradyrhizobium sp. USDA 4538]MCP1906973.1 multidrug resistance efflux pump [Bradyrhizobium sp. USDA 4537]MCP1907315.1 multidrug resistance efflux pump [Bradyrhizobium sp. USDA 4537]MCP1985449.1 multidrug resistance efflux pump [Bradyrhizobium sp. USDA 4539]
MKFLRSAATIVAIAVGVTGIATVLYAWRLPPFTSVEQSTDNAYVRGRVTILAPQLAGYIAEVAVQDFQEVKKGQILVRLDDRIYQQKLDQAKATLEGQKAALASSEQQPLSAEAKIRAGEASVRAAKVTRDNAEANDQRIEYLNTRGATTQSNLDQAQSGLEQARAAYVQATTNLDVAQQDLQGMLVHRQTLESAVAAAEAAVQLATIDLMNTRIEAPEDGKLGEIGARLGQYVGAGTQLMAIVPPKRWVIANFKETQIRRIRPGMPAKVVLDAAPDLNFTGKIETLAPATGSEFSVLRPDNATGNFTKVAQRLPIRIKFDEGQPNVERLLPGLSVTVTVDTSHGG